MKNYLLYSILIIFSITSSYAIPVSSNDETVSTHTINVENNDDGFSLEEVEKKFSKESMEKQLGRKLRFTERLALKMITKRFKKIKKRKAKKGNEEGSDKASGLSISALSLGTASLVFLLLGFVFPLFAFIGLFLAIGAIVTGAISRNKTGDKTDKFGKIGLWLGVATLGIFFILLLLYFALAIAIV